jgi:SAM-dependent methyltransferase
VLCVVENDWLADTRDSYDTVAETYAQRVNNLLDSSPYERAVLGLFAELVRGNGSGPVADVGCGTGRITAHLNELGLDAFGIDLSPGMIAQARAAFPGLRFEVGSMTELSLPAASLDGLIAWYSTIHVPDGSLPAVLGRFHSALRPGAPLLLGFHVGDGINHKTTGYGGHPMNVHVHLRQPAAMVDLLGAAGFRVEAQMTLTSPESALGCLIVARR